MRNTKSYCQTFFFSFVQAVGKPALNSVENISETAKKSKKNQVTTDFAIQAESV
jgi:hypothetical protein